MHLLGLIAAFAVGLLSSSCTLLQGYSAAPVSGRVVAMDGGAPIDNALVVIVWRLQAGIHTEDAGLLYIEETFTDAEGRFHFDGWSGKRPDRGHLAAGMPRLTVYKSGYAGRSVNNHVPPWEPGSDGQAVQSEWDNRSLELRPASSEPQRFHDQVGVLEFLFGVGTPHRCDWVRIPHTTAIALELRRYFDGRGISSTLPRQTDLELSGCADPRAVLGERDEHATANRAPSSST